jgi:hypothetical protein
MQVGDLVKSRKAHYLVLRSPRKLAQVLVQSLKTGNRVWLNKSALEVINASR